MWSRVFGEDVCSRHGCSTFFSPRCCAWRRNASPLMQSSWTAWCNSEERRKGGKRSGRARTGKVDGQRKGEATQTLSGMLYADDAGIVSRPPERPEKTMTVIVTASAAFGLTLSEAKTEIMCLQMNGGGTCHSLLLQPARCTNKRSSLCSWAGLSVQIRTSDLWW